MSFHADGRHLLSSSNDKTVRLWDIWTGQQVGALTEFHDLVRSAALSPDGQRVATASLRDVQIWDAWTRRQLVPPLLVPDVRYAVWCLTFSPDGKLLATASTDQTVRLWDATTGQEARKLQGHTNRVYSVAFSPAGHLLASGGADRQVKIWDTEKGLEQRTLSGHTDYVFGIAFSPDGRYLATASWREVIVWDASTFAELHTLGRFAGTIWSVAFSPDSKRLAAAGGYKDKGEIKIWDTTLWDKPAGGLRTRAPFGRRKEEGGRRNQEQRLIPPSSFLLPKGGWVDLAEPIIVRAGEAFLAMPEQEKS